MKKKWILCIVVAFVFSMAVFADTRSFLYEKDREIHCVDGSIINFQKCSGKIMVLKCMSVHCSPCCEETAQLNELVAQWKDTNIIFLALSIDTEKEINRFLNAHPFFYKIAANQRAFQELLQVNCFPTHVIVDQSGSIVFRQPFSSNSIAHTLNEKLEMLTNEVLDNDGGEDE